MARDGSLTGRLAVGGALVALVATAALAGATDARSVSTAAVAPAATILIGESSPIASNPNQQAITYGQVQAGKKLGWKIRTLDANLSADKQVADVDTFISLKVKGITSWTLDPGAASAVYKRANSAGIPVVGFNSAGKFVSTNVAQATDSSCAPGRDQAKYVASRIPKAKVLVIGGPPVPSITLRVTCFTKAAKAAGLTVLAKRDNVKDTAQTAQPIVQDLLTKYPDVSAVFAYNDPSALGAAAALRANGKTVWSGSKKGVIVIGMNGSNEAIDAIKAGALTATYDGNSPNAGAAAIAALSCVVKKGKPMSAMPKTILIPATRYDSANAAKFVPPMKRAVVLPAVKC